MYQSYELVGNSPSSFLQKHKKSLIIAGTAVAGFVLLLVVISALSGSGSMKPIEGLTTTFYARSFDWTDGPFRYRRIYADVDKTTIFIDGEYVDPDTKKLWTAKVSCTEKTLRRLRKFYESGLSLRSCGTITFKCHQMFESLVVPASAKKTSDTKVVDGVTTTVYTHKGHEWNYDEQRGFVKRHCYKGTCSTFDNQYVLDKSSHYLSPPTDCTERKDDFN
ncbi:hypothetical protein RCL1_002633 [Eukaryota sp. TZLM3-RCL]